MGTTHDKSWKKQENPANLQPAVKIKLRTTYQDTKVQLRAFKSTQFELQWKTRRGLMKHAAEKNNKLLPNHENSPAWNYYYEWVRVGREKDWAVAYRIDVTLSAEKATFKKLITDDLPATRQRMRSLSTQIPNLVSEFVESALGSVTLPLEPDLMLEYVPITFKVPCQLKDGE